MLMFRRCVRTVLSDTNSFSAIALFEYPSASSCSTRISLRVSGSLIASPVGAVSASTGAIGPIACSSRCR